MQEKIIKPQNGYITIAIHILIVIAGMGFALMSFAFEQPRLGMVTPLFLLAALFMAPGYFVNDPNEARAMTLFGKYKGTVKGDGFHWVNPLYKKMRISLRARNLNGEKIKVNDKNGNPIIISAVIVWQVDSTANALFAVDNYVAYVDAQSEAGLRSLAGRYPYDNFESGTEKAAVALRTEADVVNQVLEQELTKRLERAGVKIIEARINHLAYAEEIANAMLQRQQASAIVAARREIVEGAVGMVEMALQQLAEKGLVQLDEERKAAMVSNLLVVLTGDKGAQPVVNTGTLYN